MACEREKALVDELSNQLDLAIEQCDGGKGIKAACGKVPGLKAKLAAAKNALQKCLNPTRTGTVLPSYYVTALLYNPPGKNSEVAYGQSSTLGTTVECTRSFTSGAKIEVSSGGVGGEEGFQIGTKSGTSFEVKKEISSELKLSSHVDTVDHEKDELFIWTNVQLDLLAKTDQSLLLNLLPQKGPNMNIVQLTVAELRNRNSIPASKAKLLTNLTQHDFNNILKLNPLASQANSRIPPDPQRYRYITTLQIVGPDREGDPTIGKEVGISDEKAKDIIHGSSHKLEVGLTVEGEASFFVQVFKLASTATFELEYETQRNVSSGSKQEATVLLQTDSIGFHDVIDIYQDTIFLTFCFVSRSGPVAGDAAMVTATVTNKLSRPISHQRVDVIERDGRTRTVFTDAKGVFRLFSVAEGDVQIKIGNLTQNVSLHRDKPRNLSFSLSKL